MKSVKSEEFGKSDKPTELQDAFSRLILSASGWRGVFSPSGDENDDGAEVPPVMLRLAEIAAGCVAVSFLDAGAAATGLLLGRDTRPTGAVLAAVFQRVFAAAGIPVQDVGAAAAPEIMAASYCRKMPFVYVSASHNPIGHNGFKFGTGDGGVIAGGHNADLAATFRDAVSGLRAVPAIPAAGADSPAMVGAKEAALRDYRTFAEQVLGDPAKTRAVLAGRVRVIADMNGSARCLSIDREWFTALGCDFTAVNDEAGRIVHGILPEGKNLAMLTAEVERAGKEGGAALVLGYMPDCDGDRGNIVFWDESTARARVLDAQEVFALAVTGVLREQAASTGGQKRAVVVNGPTSMRIDRIAERFGAAVFRAEVGEANVVNLAREKRREGWAVAILGEGSNGGTILHPQAVRDPLATVTVLLKLLAGDSAAISALPAFCTTPVDEARAKLHIRETDHAALKRRYQKLFLARWPALRERYGFTAYKAVTYNSTKSRDCTADFSESGRGGLKVLLYQGDTAAAFIWGRGSGTEPLFRVLADAAGSDGSMERELLEVQRALLMESDI